MHITTRVGLCVYVGTSSMNSHHNFGGTFDMDVSQDPSCPTQLAGTVMLPKNTNTF